MNKPFAPACERNQEAILGVLSRYLTRKKLSVLELGSGTGQHAVYFCRYLPNVSWQPSELASCLDGINAWVDEARLSNLASAIELDVNERHSWPLAGDPKDAVFMANTLHFVSEQAANAFIELAAKVLKVGGRVFVYGPFNDAGKYTSEGNIGLDAWLKQRDPESGLKDWQWLDQVCSDNSLVREEVFEMPANNYLYVYQVAG